MKTEPAITRRFVHSLFDMAQQPYSESVVRQTKLCLLDYLGVALTGARMLHDKNGHLLDALGAPEGPATVIGLNRKTTPQTAALLNGLSSHVAELDDGERTAMMHPGAPIVSALLAVTQQESLDGKDLLRGIVVGYEAALRSTGAMQPGLKDRGYHGTGIGGTIGAALGIAAALRFTESQMKDALSAAATSASGLLKMIHGESEMKPYNAAQAALNGLTAAAMARAGFTGAADVLEGNKGFLAMLSNDTFDLSRLEWKEGDPLRIERIYRKPYAACRHCHSPIEAALRLKKNGVRPEQIETVDIRTYRWAVGGHDHTDIQGMTSAKMSIPFSVAVALVTGKAGLDAFAPDKVEDNDILALTKRIRVHSDDALSALVPEKRAAIVEVTTTAGEPFTERVDYPKGEPENPITDAEGRDKFMSLAVYGGKSESEAEEILSCVWEVESSIARLFELLS